MVKSPCINVCRMHPEYALCRGCYRTLEEIADWSMMPDADKEQVLREVEERRVRIGPLPLA